MEREELIKGINDLIEDRQALTEERGDIFSYDIEVLTAAKKEIEGMEEKEDKQVYVLTGYYSDDELPVRVLAVYGDKEEAYSSLREFADKFKEMYAPQKTVWIDGSIVELTRQYFKDGALYSSVTMYSIAERSVL